MDSLLTDEDAKLQRHKHTICYKKISFWRCRFGISYPPMITIHILDPLEFNMSTATNEEIASNASLKETANRTYKLIDEYDKCDTDLDTISLLDFLNELNLTEVECITALRSCITRPTIFLQLKMNELRTNAHNVTFLKIFFSQV